MALFNRTTMLIGRGIVPRLAAVLLLAFAAAPDAHAQAVDCSDFPGGIIDGNFVSSPTNINVDVNCTIRNFPQGLTTELIANISFFSDGGSGGGNRLLLIFDNVYHSGQMSCATVQNHKIWFVNGASTDVQEKCQNLLIPVEKIDKQNPPGDAATVGVPFTYRLVESPRRRGDGRRALHLQAGHPGAVRCRDRHRDRLRGIAQRHSRRRRYRRP
jgi:hypothetical protein